MGLGLRGLTSLILCPKLGVYMYFGISQQNQHHEDAEGSKWDSLLPFQMCNLHFYAYLHHKVH